MSRNKTVLFLISYWFCVWYYYSHTNSIKIIYGKMEISGYCWKTTNLIVVYLFALTTGYYHQTEIVQRSNFTNEKK